jgi:hypothetical protein
MVKGYIAGTRKERNRQAREDEGPQENSTPAARTRKMKSNKTSSDSDVDEPSDDDNRPRKHNKPTTTTMTSSISTKSKKHPRSHSTGIETSDHEDDPCHKASTRKSHGTSSTNLNVRPRLKNLPVKRRSKSDANPYDSEVGAGPSKKPRRSTHNDNHESDPDPNDSDPTMTGKRSTGKRNRVGPDSPEHEDSDGRGSQVGPSKKPRRSTRNGRNSAQSAGKLHSDVENEIDPDPSPIAESDPQPTTRNLNGNSAIARKQQSASDVDNESDLDPNCDESDHNDSRSDDSYDDSEEMNNDDVEYY